MTKPNKFLAVLLSCVLLLSAISAPASASGIGGGGYSSGGGAGRNDWFDVNNYNPQTEWSHDGTASLTLDHVDSYGRWFRINTTVYSTSPVTRPVRSTSNYCTFSFIGRDNGNSMSVECNMTRTNSSQRFEIDSQSLIPYTGTYYLGISVDNLAYTYTDYLPVIKCGSYDITSSPLGYHLSDTSFSALSGDIKSYLSTNIFSISAATHTRTLNETVSFFLVLTDSSFFNDTPSIIDDDLFTGIGGKIPNKKIIDTTEKKIYSPRQDIDIPFDVDLNFSFDFNTYAFTYVDTSNNITYNITYGDDKVVYAEQYTENGDIINYTYNYYYTDPTLLPGDSGNTGLGGLLDNFWSWLGELLSSLWDFILDIVGDLFTLIKTIIQGFLSIFTTTVTEIITSLGNFFTYYTDGTLYDFTGVT